MPLALSSTPLRFSHRGGTGRTVTPSGALRVDGDTLWGVSVSRSGEFNSPDLLTETPHRVSPSTRRAPDGVTVRPVPPRWENRKGVEERANGIAAQRF